MFVRLSLGQLILTSLSMGMIHEKNLDGSSSRLDSPTGGDDDGDPNAGFW